MKSIKEKANEYTKDYLFSTLFSTLPQKAPNVHFEAGANYVLEQIEKELPLDDKCLNDYGKALVWRLKNCIEQLKK